MKSFQAKMYIEEDLATIEFDIQLTGGEDPNDDMEFFPNWSFILLQHKTEDWYAFLEKEFGMTHEEVVEKYPTGPVMLGIYDADSMNGVGQMTAMDQDDKDFNAVQEETLKFLDFYIEGRQCIKFNYIYPPNPSIIPASIAPDQKQVSNKNSVDVFVRKPGNNEFEFVKSFPPITIPQEELEELNQNKQAIQQNKMPTEYPDGTTSHVYDTIRDQEGNFITSPSKDEK